jgi:LPXTG-motif cell wall-anchored protein
LSVPPGGNEGERDGDGSSGRKDVKRLATVVVGTISFALLSASSALAQSNIPEPEVLGEVVVPPGAEPGSTAFTGSDITVWMFAAAALLVLGVGLLFAARRRARSATHT